MFGITPVPIYDPENKLPDFAETMIFFRPGDIVKFRAIDEPEFRAIDLYNEKLIGALNAS